MSETSDKRRRADLDLFILTLVDQGVSTPYAMQKLASLSQGATNPALQRLLDAGFLFQGKPGARRRRDYRVSASGKRLLRDGWLPLLEAGGSGDVDADLRVALLAISADGNPRRAADYMMQSADRIEESIEAMEPALDINETPPIAKLYNELRFSAAKTMLSAKAKALRSMADSIARHPGRKSGRGKATPRKRTAR